MSFRTIRVRVMHICHVTPSDVGPLTICRHALPFVCHIRHEPLLTAPLFSPSLLHFCFSTLSLSFCTLLLCSLLPYSLLLYSLPSLLSPFSTLSLSTFSGFARQAAERMLNERADQQKDQLSLSGLLSPSAQAGQPSQQAGQASSHAPLLSPGLRGSPKMSPVHSPPDSATGSLTRKSQLTRS